MSWIHCDQETEILETNGQIRVRECKVCGTKFQTEEVLKQIIVPFGANQSKRKLIPCPYKRAKLKKIMESHTTLNEAAKACKVSISTFNRWVREHDL